VKAVSPQAVAGRDSAAALAEAREAEVTRLLEVVADSRREVSALQSRLVSGVLSLVPSHLAGVPMS
jgi:predicted DNA-binding ribbon-helix-helix protein